MPADALRLFFALPCPPGLGRQICTWREAQHWQGRPVPSANLHLTLAFLGSQPASRLDALRALGHGIRVPAFVLQLDRAGLIGGAHGCLLPNQTPSQLLQLVDALRQGLEALGVAVDPRPFRPHVTLLRDACAAPRTAPALIWPVRCFGLYASRQQAGGVHYQALGSWPLGSDS